MCPWLGCQGFSVPVGHYMKLYQSAISTSNTELAQVQGALLKIKRQPCSCQTLPSFSQMAPCPEEKGNAVIGDLLTFRL